MPTWFIRLQTYSRRAAERLGLIPRRVVQAELALVAGYMQIWFIRLPTFSRRAAENPGTQCTYPRRVVQAELALVRLQTFGRRAAERPGERAPKVVAQERVEDRIDSAISVAEDGNELVKDSQPLRHAAEI